MRAISCYYLVIAYLMLRVVRLTSSLTKRPGRPYGDFFRNTRPILGQVAIFSMATMLLDEFIMFYILRKFGLEKKRILLTGRPLDKETEANDDDCCICYGAMLGDDDDEAADFSYREAGISRDTDHVLENFCVVKQHVAHRGCIRKWYNYGPKGYRPMEAFRIFRWGTTLHNAVAGMQAPVVGGRVGLGWLLSFQNQNEQPPNVALRIPLQQRTPPDPTQAANVQPTVQPTDLDPAAARILMDTDATPTTTLPDTQPTLANTTALTEQSSISQRHDHDHQVQPQAQAQALPQPEQQQEVQQQLQDSEQEQPHETQRTNQTEVHMDVQEPPVVGLTRPLLPQPDEYSLAKNAGGNTCPACRQQLMVNFVDLAKGRQEMTYKQKIRALVQDMTRFSDWRGLVLRSLITAGWVGVTIVGGKLRILAIDKALAKHQRNRALATVSAISH
ncbi:hypothetical protein BGZ94_004313 [Podila epigama]|nr:hypothetical protein BGZ94_004313 [Podila epigama]